MRLTWIVAVLALTTVASGALFLDGRTLMGSGNKPKVEIRSMQWGQRDAMRDRLIGKVKINDIRGFEDIRIPVEMNFDVFNSSAVKTNTVSVKFDMLRYGYHWRGSTIEGEFCVDFPPSLDARRMSLASVLYNGESVVYRTVSDISNSMLKNNFTLREPKTIPLNQRGGSGPH